MLMYAMVMVENLLTLAGLNREEGQGMAEYALIIALVAIALVTALGVLQGGISGTFDAIVAAFNLQGAD